MFFRHCPRQELRTTSFYRGALSFETALILMSMHNYDASLTSLISALEAFLSTEKSSSDQVDDRNIWKKMKDFDNNNPNFRSEFRRRTERSRSPEEMLYEACELRNRIVHSGRSEEHQCSAAKHSLGTLLPILQVAYRSIFDAELYEEVVVEIRRSLDIAQYLHTLQEDEESALINLRPVTWSVQHYISPNFSPKYLFDREGYQVDMGQNIFNALSGLEAIHQFDEVGIECPICREVSAAVSFVDEDLATNNQLNFEKIICVNCQLEIGSSSSEKKLAAALFDSYITENEPRILKEFGLL